MVSEAQDKDDTTLATTNDEATKTSSTDAVALDATIIDVEVGVVDTGVIVEAAEQNAAIPSEGSNSYPGGDDVEETWSAIPLVTVLLLFVVGIQVCTRSAPLRDNVNPVQGSDGPLRAGVADNHAVEEVDAQQQLVKGRVMEEIGSVIGGIAGTTQRLRAR